MNLMATQLGTKKKVAADEAGKKITVPAMENFAPVKGNDSKYTYKLKHTPLAAPTEIYVLADDSTFGQKYKLGTDNNGDPLSTAAADTFGFVTDTIYLPTGITGTEEMFVMYEYESGSAVEVVNSATEFPVGCKFVMEVLGCDVCNQTDLIYAYVIFDNFKLSPDFDWSIATDGSHPFSGKAQQAYCDREKRLFSIVIPETEDEE